MATVRFDVISASWLTFIHAPERGSAVAVVFSDHQCPASLRLQGPESEGEMIQVQKTTHHFRIQGRIIHNTIDCVGFVLAT